MKITAKEVRAAAASVRGARGMGIETAASMSAPALLASAEQALAAMFRKASGLEPSAPDQSSEAAYYAAFAKADALESAVAELREALGVPAPAVEVVEPAPAVEAEHDAAAEEAAAAAEEAAAAAAEAARLARWDEALQAQRAKIYSVRGERLVWVQTRAARYGESRFSSLSGWDAGGEKLSEAEFELQTRDGRAVQQDEWYVVVDVFGYDVEALEYINGRRAGAYGMSPNQSATSDWLPPGAAEPLTISGFVKNPRYAGDCWCASVWKEAEAARREERAAAREAVPAQEEKTWTLADLAAFSKNQKRRK